jgi:hypothetical protein
MNDEVVLPIAPLWSHFQHLVYPRPYQDWIDYDLELIDRVDAVLRLDASCERINYHQHRSTGADGEVDHAAKLGFPVFYSIDDLYEWASTHDA